MRNLKQDVSQLTSISIDNFGAQLLANTVHNSNTKHIDHQGMCRQWLKQVTSLYNNGPMALLVTSSGPSPQITTLMFARNTWKVKTFLPALDDGYQH